MKVKVGKAATPPGDLVPVEIPDAVVPGQPVAVKIGGVPYVAEWLPHAAVLSLKDAAGVERNLRLRAAAVAREGGDADAAVTLEAGAGPAVHCVSLVVKPDVPGQAARAKAKAGGAQTIRSQITGKVIKVLVKAQDRIDAGQALLIIEAMKMENRVFAAAGGVVLSVAVKDGDAVQTGKELLKIAHA